MRLNNFETKLYVILDIIDLHSSSSHANPQPMITNEEISLENEQYFLECIYIKDVYLIV